jgi:membrane associated rhomboid family serine protease
MIPLSDDTRRTAFPFVTIAVIVINVLVYFGWQTRIGMEESVALAAFVPAEFTRGLPGGVSHLFTSIFMHGSIMHLLGNMWFLWIFGDNIENAMGSVRFVIFYMLCGIAATLAHVWSSPASVIPLVGASGSISGVLGAYLVRHPKANVRTLIPLGAFTRILDVPAFVFLFIWIGIQIISETASRARPESAGVAYLAHIGGFVAGVVLIFVFMKKHVPSPPPRAF